jgi:1,4-dihydroxy-6-naphthoate synthase
MPMTPMTPTTTPTPTRAATRLIRVAHSPDPDDAFMFHGLASGAIDTAPYELVHELGDIESLNRRALAGELELTALSFAAYPYLADRYRLLSTGASVGDGYGPMLVARDPDAPIAGSRIAVPGERTTAVLALRLMARATLPGVDLDLAVVPFDTIPAEVEAGRADLGLLIHEGQLTYGDSGLELIADLGRWWRDTTGLPLPLGGNAVRRDLGDQVAADLAALLHRSIVYGLEHRAPALAYAARFGRGLSAERADRFVGMYVNDWTRDLGDEGRDAVRRLLEEAHAAGLIPAMPPLDFVPSLT